MWNLPQKYNKNFPPCISHVVADVLKIYLFYVIPAIINIRKIIYNFIKKIYCYISVFIATLHVKIYNRLIHTSNGLSFSPYLHASNFLRQIWLMAREEYFGFRLELSHDLLLLL